MNNESTGRNWDHLGNDSAKSEIHQIIYQNEGASHPHFPVYPVLDLNWYQT